MTHSAFIRLLFPLSLATGLTVASAQAESTDCSLASLNGSYGFTLSGSYVPAAISYATTGRFVSDGHGSVTGSVVESVNGSISSGTFTATYTVAKDCTGTAVFNFNNGSKSELVFTIVSGGREALLMDTDPGTVETGTAKKQDDGLER